VEGGAERWEWYPEEIKSRWAEVAEMFSRISGCSDEDWYISFPYYLKMLAYRVA
jgi:hypothetical protein